MFKEENAEDDEGDMETEEEDEENEEEYSDDDDMSWKVSSLFKFVDSDKLNVKITSRRYADVLQNAWKQ